MEPGLFRIPRECRRSRDSLPIRCPGPRLPSPKQRGCARRPARLSCLKCVPSQPIHSRIDLLAGMDHRQALATDDVDVSSGLEDMPVGTTVGGGDILGISGFQMHHRTRTSSKGGAPEMPVSIKCFPFLLAKSAFHGPIQLFTSSTLSPRTRAQAHHVPSGLPCQKSANPPRLAPSVPSPPAAFPSLTPSAHRAPSSSTSGTTCSPSPASPSPPAPGAACCTRRRGACGRCRRHRRRPDRGTGCA